MKNLSGQIVNGGISHKKNAICWWQCWQKFQPRTITNFYGKHLQRGEWCTAHSTIDNTNFLAVNFFSTSFSKSIYVWVICLQKKQTKKDQNKETSVPLSVSYFPKAKEILLNYLYIFCSSKYIHLYLLFPVVILSSKSSSYTSQMR